MRATICPNCKEHEVYPFMSATTSRGQVILRALYSCTCGTTIQEGYVVYGSVKEIMKHLERMNNIIGSLDYFIGKEIIKTMLGETGWTQIQAHELSVEQKMKALTLLDIPRLIITLLNRIDSFILLPLNISNAMKNISTYFYQNIAMRHARSLDKPSISSNTICMYIP